jgi:hypothetical protein
MTRAGVRGGWPWRDSCLSGGGAWGPCGLSTCGGCEQQRTQPPDTGNEVTTHNGGYSGEALRAHSRPPGPGARAGWRPAALYTALCRGYRFGRGAARLCRAHWKGGLLRLVRSCDDQEHTPCGRGGSGRSFFTAGNGAEPRSSATSWGSGVSMCWNEDVITPQRWRQSQRLHLQIRVDVLIRCIHRAIKPVIIACFPAGDFAIIKEKIEPVVLCLVATIQNKQDTISFFFDQGSTPTSHFLIPRVHWHIIQPRIIQCKTITKRILEYRRCDLRRDHFPVDFNATMHEPRQLKQIGIIVLRMCLEKFGTPQNLFHNKQFHRFAPR